LIPFFVVDRPMSLNIVKSFFVKHPGIKFGLMSHALVSEAFRGLYATFPCDLAGCWLGERQVSDSCLCAPELVNRLRQSVIKAVDYGIFSKGRSLPYPKLFDIYESMGADLGIMKDVFGDARRTVESAKRAVESYERRQRGFKLVLVAQGNSLDEYLWCMDRLTRLGVGELAIGGLLRRKVNSARYSSAGKLADIDSVLSAIARAHPERKLFVLGCYHPKRHQLFESRSVFASDYKGWIFNYEHRIDRIDRLHLELMDIEAQHGCSEELAKVARRRRALAGRTAAQRKAYAVTKNDGSENSVLKAQYRARFAELLGQLERLDEALIRLRRFELTRDLPAYSEIFLAFEDAIRHTEQEVRVAGVHEYFNEQILPLMRLTPPANGLPGKPEASKVAAACSPFAGSSPTLLPGARPISILAPDCNISTGPFAVGTD
jgi:hypothetical protein